MSSIKEAVVYGLTIIAFVAIMVGTLSFMTEITRTEKLTNPVPNIQCYVVTKGFMSSVACWKIND